MYITTRMFTILTLLLTILPLAINSDKNASIACSEQCSCIKMLNNEDSIIVNCTNISDIPGDIPLKLNELVLSHNGFGQFDLANLAHFTQLKKLVLEHCDISEFISHSYLTNQLPNLEILDLSHNNLSRIPADLPSNLKSLSLSHNLITVVHYGESLSHLKNLKELFLDHNLLPAIKSGTFHDADEGTSLNSLLKLALNSNRLSFIASNSFDKLSSVAALTLADNKLIHLEREIFIGLTNLRHLDASHNKLSHMDDDTFQDLSQLKYLNLNSNKLASFPRRLPMLEWLDMSHNLMRVITENSKADIYPVEVLNLAHNPFHCDCYLRWLKELFDRREYLVKHIDLNPKDFIPSCESPENLAGETWNRLSDKSFRCDTQADEQSENDPHSDSNVDISTRIGLVTDATIQLMWSSSTPSFSTGNVLIQYYVFGHRTASMKHVEVAAAQPDYVIKHLRPLSNYVICVRAKQVARDNHRETPPPPLSLDDCIEVATKEPKPPPLASRLEVFWYYILGMLATFIGIFAVIGGFAMLYGLWNSKTDWSSKYISDESYLDESTYATDEPITNDKKPHKD